MTASTVPPLDLAVDLGTRDPSRSRRMGRGLLRFARHKPLGAFGAVFLVLMVLAAVLADVVAPYDPIQPGSEVLKGPSGSHLFGTDHLGRDVFSRIVYGARPSLYTGILVVGLTTILGTAIGAASGYFGGPFDLALQRIIDGLMAFPSLVLTLAVVSALGNRVHYSVSLAVVGALVAALVPGTARILRGVALSQRGQQYVDAARVVGCSDLRILWRHVLPNLVAPIIVVASIQLGAVILAESSLSFLGYGTPPPTPTWGGMLSRGGSQFMQIAPWLAIFPGLALSLAVLGFNLFGDALRDVLDPRLRK